MDPEFQRDLSIEEITELKSRFIGTFGSNPSFALDRLKTLSIDDLEAVKRELDHLARSLGPSSG